MKKNNYMLWRNSYYTGILLLVVYALPEVSFIKEYAYPVLQAELATGLPLISAVALFTGVTAYMAFKYRKIG